MIKLNLQSPRRQSQTATNLEKKVTALYSNASRSEKNAFSLLAGRLLAALTSGDREDLEFIANRLTVSCETTDDLRNLMYNAGVLMRELGERLIRE